MSKTYIVSRNGGTVTKAPINDNKLPIYANETALDEDLANIPDNTLVATKGGHDDVINQMKEYIRNQNVLSDWETISARPSSTSDYQQEDYDGFLMINITHGSSTSYAYIYYSDDGGINWYKNVIQVNGDGDSDGASCTLPIKKGSRWYLSQPTQSGVSIWGSYYKLRDYKGR